MDRDWRGHGQSHPGHAKAEARAGWRQGFVSNITNPKVLVFYLAVLPQFLTPGAGLGWLLGFSAKLATEHI